MLRESMKRLAIPDFVKGALFTAVLFSAALGFASHKAPKQQQDDRAYYREVVGPSGVASPTQQERKQNGAEKPVAQEGAFGALTDWLLDFKLSDFLLIGFTAVLAWKTAGLDESTRRLWSAGEKQIAVAERNAAAAEVASNAALASIEITRRGLTAANRALLDAEPTLGDAPLTIDENGASIYIVPNIVNRGNAPALNVRIGLRIVAARQSQPGGPTADLRILIQDTRERPSGFPFDLMPNAATQPNSAFCVQISKDDLDEGFRASSNGAFVSLYLIGCATYTFDTAFGEKFNCNFVRCIQKKGTVFISSSDKYIPWEQLTLFKSPF